MKTKYILHGGGAQKVNPQNTKFFQEILKDTPVSLKILLVHFAIDPINSEINFQRDTFQFKTAQANKKTDFIVSNKLFFVEQIKNSNIIYFSGGVSTQKLLDELEQFHDINKYIKGKIIAGESAGANFLSEYGYSPASKTILKCRGLVPVKLIPHYHPGDEVLFDGSDPKLKLLMLKDFQFKTFTI